MIRESIDLILEDIVQDVEVSSEDFRDVLIETTLYENNLVLEYNDQTGVSIELDRT